MRDAPAPGSLARIVVRLPNWVGDAVMATPALRALRASHFDAEIVLEGPAHLEGLVRGLDVFDRYLPDPGRVWSRASGLATGDFDCAILFPDSPRAALGPFLARIPRRVGHAREPLRRTLLTNALPAPSARSRRTPIPMTERFLALTRLLGCPDRGLHPELPVDATADEEVGKRLEACGSGPDARLLVVTPGAGFGDSKRWPPSHFATACDGIAEATGLLPVLAPGPGESGLARTIADGIHGRSILLDAPPTSLPQLTALLSRAALLLTNDTGPRQIAVAVDCPVVVVMGPTDPRHTAHHLERQRVLREDVECSPCHRPRCPIDHRCMRRLAPERAVQAARELLS